MQTDPSSGAGDRPLVSERAVGCFVAAAFVVAGAVLALDNYRLGIRWEREGPDSGYFPFGLSVLMMVFGLVALVDAWRTPRPAAFVTRAQAGRVLIVLVPTVAFVALTQVIGIYVASAALIAGFMAAVGKSRPWLAVLVGIGVAVAMFYIFEIQFQVPLPKGPLEDWLGY